MFAHIKARSGTKEKTKLLETFKQPEAPERPEHLAAEGIIEVSGKVSYALRGTELVGLGLKDESVEEILNFCAASSHSGAGHLTHSAIKFR